MDPPSQQVSTAYSLFCVHFVYRYFTSNIIALLLFSCIYDIMLSNEGYINGRGDIMDFNFDFSYLKNGTPIVTLSSFGISFNKGAIESLGVPNQVIIGFDQAHCAIGVRARGNDTSSPYYDFASRVKNDWVRIGAKDFTKYLARISGIDFLTKAKQFIADFDEETQTLIVVIDEQHLK